MEYQKNVINDELFNIKKGIMNLELLLKEAELELDFYKIRMTAERFPGINPRYIELQIQKREIQVEIAKEELKDLQIKLEMKLNKTPE